MNGEVTFVRTEVGTLALTDDATTRMPARLARQKPVVVRGPRDVLFVSHLRLGPRDPLFYVLRPAEGDWQLVRALSIGIAASSVNAAGGWPRVQAMSWNAPSEQLVVLLDASAFGRRAPWTCVAIPLAALDAYPREPMPVD